MLIFIRSKIKSHPAMNSDQSSGGSRIYPRGGAPTPKVGARTYFVGRKLHENERILAPGGRASLAPPLDPPLQRADRQTGKCLCSANGALSLIQTN